MSDAPDGVLLTQVGITLGEEVKAPSSVTEISPSVRRFGNKPE